MLGGTGQVTLAGKTSLIVFAETFGSGKFGTP